MRTVQAQINFENYQDTTKGFDSLYKNDQILKYKDIKEISCYDIQNTLEKLDKEKYRMKN